MFTVKCKIFSHFKSSSFIFTFLHKNFPFNMLKRLYNYHSFLDCQTVLNDKQLQTTSLLENNLITCSFSAPSNLLIHLLLTTAYYRHTNRILFEVNMMCCHLTSTEDMCNDSPLVQNTCEVNTGGVTVQTSDFRTCNFQLVLHDLLFMNFFFNSTVTVYPRCPGNII
jgi:hypothetical protein